MTHDEVEKEVERKCSALRAFFPPERIGWETRPYSATLFASPGAMITLVPFAASEAIQDRLDAVLGENNWQEQYTREVDFTRCVLTVRFVVDGDWVTRVGLSAAEEPDRAHAEALRDAARKLGVGRYLTQWPAVLEWGGSEKGFATAPQLPEAALPHEYRRCGRESAQKLRQILTQVCVEAKAKGFKVDELEAARLIAQSFGHKARPDGHVDLSRLQVREYGAALSRVNAWLAELVSGNKNPPSSPYFRADTPAAGQSQPPKTEEKKINPPSSETTQSPHPKATAPTGAK